MAAPDWRKWLTDKGSCKEWLDNYVRKGVLRKDRMGKELYMKKSRHNMDFAAWLIMKHDKEIPELFAGDNFYDWVINAYYYAIYHAAMALVSEKGYSSKSHSATLCAVTWFYYHQKRALERKDIEMVGEAIGSDDIEIIAKTKDMRERASYGVSESFEMALVESAKKNAVNFTAKAGSILER